MSVFYAIAKFVTNLLIHILYKMRYEGVENIPEGGGYMVCSNHRTNMDPLFIAQKLKTQLFFMAKQELFQNKFVSLIIRGLGAFPVERGKGDSSAIDFAVDTLKSGRRAPAPRTASPKGQNPGPRWWPCRPARIFCRWGFPLTCHCASGLLLP